MARREKYKPTPRLLSRMVKTTRQVEIDVPRSVLVTALRAYALPSGAQPFADLPHDVGVHVRYDDGGGEQSLSLDEVRLSFEVVDVKEEDL